MPSLKTFNNKHRSQSINIHDEGMEVEYEVSEKDQVLVAEGHDIGIIEGHNVVFKQWLPIWYPLKNNDHVL